MNKKQFERELRGKLGGLPPEERQRVLDYYNELSQEKLENGYNEDDIIDSFGSIDEIAAGVMSDAAANKDSRRGTETRSYMPPENSKAKERSGDGGKWYRNKTLWTVYFSLFFITIPLTIAAFSVVLGLCIAAFALVISFFVCTVAFIIVGPIYAVSGAILAFTNIGAGLAQVGAALGVIALGIAFLVLARLLFRLIKKALVKNDDVKRRRSGRSNLAAGIACIVFVVLGAGTFVTGYSMAGWDIRNLDTNKYTFVTEQVTQSVNKLEINVTTRAVQVIKTADSTEWRVEYYNTEECEAEVTVADGVLKITDNNDFYKFSINQLLYIFSWVNFDRALIKIYVPDTIQQIDAALTAGAFAMDGFTVDSAKLNVTTGSIDVENSNFNALEAKATAGSIDVKNCAVTYLKADATTGSIRAKIRGSKDDYDIKASATVGSSNIPNQDREGDNKIILNVTTGGIHVTFTN